MLMLSDCLPAPGGGQRAERAWGLLRGVCSTHQVYLAFHAEQPVNLVQWRLIAGMVSRVHIEQSYLRRKQPAPIGGEAGEWLRTRRFDALLVTSPRIWPSGDTGFADYSFCDFSNDVEYPVLEHPRPSGPPGGWLSRWVRPLQRRTAASASIPKDTLRFDYAIVSSDRQAVSLKPHASTTVVIPDTTTGEHWTQLIHSIQHPMLTTHPVTVMPVTPQHQPARKAA